MTVLPSCSCDSTIVWLHYLDVNKMSEEKARWKLHKNAACCFEQILEAAPCKTEAVWPLTSYLTNNQSKMRKICLTLLVKKGQSCKQHSPVDSYTWKQWCWLTIKDLHSSTMYGYWMLFRGLTKSNC